MTSNSIIPVSIIAAAILFLLIGMLIWIAPTSTEHFPQWLSLEFAQILGAMQFALFLTLRQ